jgi:peroxiredoxin Q/BCP
MKSSMLQTGQAAPPFSLPDADMETVALADFRGRKTVVLYFYPKDRTPGCTMQAIEFSDHERDFEKFDSVVLGVSCDDCITHAEFRDENGLSVRLLADPDGDVCRAYGVWREPTEARRSCIVRSTFVIDKRGKVQHALYGVTPKGHAAEILGLLKSL